MSHRVSVIHEPFFHTLRVKKRDTLLVSIISWNINRFSKFFHCRTQRKLFYKKISTHPTTL